MQTSEAVFTVISPIVLAIGWLVFWIAPIILGITYARWTRVSTRWMWLGALPGLGWLLFIIIRGSITPNSHFESLRRPLFASGNVRDCAPRGMVRLFCVFDWLFQVKKKRRWLIAGAIWLFLVGLTASQTDSGFWDITKDSDDPMKFSQYLAKFPNGNHRQEATLRMQQLQTEQQLLTKEKEIVSCVQATTQKADAVYIRGKVVVLFRDREEGDGEKPPEWQMSAHRAQTVQHSLPDRLRPAMLQEVQTVVCLDCVHEILARYGGSEKSGVTATREKCTITVFDLNLPLVSGVTTIEAPYPKEIPKAVGGGPLFRTYPPHEYVSDKAIVNYLKGLPTK